MSTRLQVCLMAAAMMLAACSRQGRDSRRSESSNEVPEKAPPASADWIAATVETTAADTRTEDPVAAKLLSGTEIQLADGKALEVIFTRVFGADNARGSGDPYLRDTPGRVFTIAEHRLVGSYDIRSLDVNRTRGQWLTSLSQEYVRVVRDALAGSCGKLVTREFAAANSDQDVSANILIKSKNAPTAAQLNDFMTRFFGFEPAKGKFHEGADAYASAFEAAMTEPDQPFGTDVGALTRDTYKAICIAIGQDFRVLLR